MIENVAAWIERAESLERARQFAEAATVWQQIAARPLVAADGISRTDALKRQAGAAFRAGQFEVAIEILHGLRATAEDPELLSLLARVFVEANRFEEAIEAGRRAVMLDPEAIQARKLLGRAFMKLGERVGANGAAIHWQEAIDQFTDVLVFNPQDQLSKELKLQCVRKRDGSFEETMQSEFRRFERLFEQDDRKAGLDVLAELVRVVIEHAVDLQQSMPTRMLAVAGEFMAMVEQYSRRSSVELAGALQPVFAQLHSLAMWAHLAAGEPGAAELDVEAAIKADGQGTLPWASKAELMFALQREDQVEPALAHAAAAVRSEHDKFMMAAAHHLIGGYAAALEWADRINLDRLRAEAHRPDRAERVLARLKSEVRGELEMNVARTPEEVASGDVGDLIKRLLTGGSPVPAPS